MRPFSPRLFFLSFSHLLKDGLCVVVVFVFKRPFRILPIRTKTRKTLSTKKKYTKFNLKTQEYISQKKKEDKMNDDLLIFIVLSTSTILQFSFVFF